MDRRVRVGIDIDTPQQLDEWPLAVELYLVDPNLVPHLQAHGTIFVKVSGEEFNPITVWHRWYSINVPLGWSWMAKVPEVDQLVWYVDGGHVRIQHPARQTPIGGPTAGWRGVNLTDWTVTDGLTEQEVQKANRDMQSALHPRANVDMISNVNLRQKVVASLGQ